MVEVLDDLMIQEGIGVFYVNEDAVVHAYNQVAHNLLKNNDVLSIKKGKLTTKDRGKYEELCYRIKCKCNCYSAKESLLIKQAKSPHPVKLSLFSSNNIVRGDDLSNLVVVLAKDTSIKEKFLASDFADFYNLTEAEKKLSQSLFEGFTLNEHSEKRGIKITTTRWTLNNVFSKTVTSSQIELIGLFRPFTE